MKLFLPIAYVSQCLPDLTFKCSFRSRSLVFYMLYENAKPKSMGQVKISSCHN